MCNAHIVQLVYAQAYAFCTHGYYALDVKTIPLLGALRRGPWGHLLAGRSFSLGVIHVKWSGMQENDFAARG